MHPLATERQKIAKKKAPPVEKAAILKRHYHPRTLSSFRKSPLVDEQYEFREKTKEEGSLSWCLPRARTGKKGGNVWAGQTKPRELEETSARKVGSRNEEVEKTLVVADNCISAAVYLSRVDKKSLRLTGGGGYNLEEEEGAVAQTHVW